VCASAVVMLDTPCSEVVWRVLDTHSVRQFPLYFPSCASPCAITFQLDSTTADAHTSAASSRLNWHPADLNRLSSVSPKGEIWFLRVCHHISNAVYHPLCIVITLPLCVLYGSQNKLQLFLYNIHRLDFITEAESVYSAVRTESLYNRYVSSLKS